MKIKNQEFKHGCNIIKTTLEFFLILLGFGLASLFVPGSNSGFHIASNCPTWVCSYTFGTTLIRTRCGLHTESWSRLISSLSFCLKETGRLFYQIPINLIPKARLWWDEVPTLFGMNTIELLNYSSYWQTKLCHFMTKPWSALSAQTIFWVCCKDTLN